MQLLLSLLLVLSAAAAQPWDGVAINDVDFQGLRAFKASLIDQRGVLKSWNDSGEGACNGGWLGIKCAQGQVISVSLPWRGLGGVIAAAVAQLSGLRKLNLHDNAIQGQIPSSLGYLSSLRALYLFNNRLSGLVPASLGRCPLLQTLDLSNNSLSGPIPAGLAAAGNLFRVNLSFNGFSGGIPDSWSSGKLRFVALDANRLAGGLPPSIGKLVSLEVFTASDNLINGSLPAGFWNLTVVSVLNLAGNAISGELPEEIGGLKNLTFFSLKGNQFRGPIPVSLSEISGLSALDLSENGFSGEIPDSLGNLPKLGFLNLSSNNLSGAVPAPLSAKFGGDSFRGNVDLCGFKGGAACPAPPPNSPVESNKKLSVKDIILIVIGSVLFVLLLVCCALLACLIRKRSALKKMSQEKTTTAAATTAVEEAGGKLVHFDGAMAFTADDLLCATAEIMGKSTYGTVYKATLEDGGLVAVKRLREKIAKSQKEFEVEVGALGKARHDNLLPLRAYYVGPKGEKLLVFDFMPMGSLTAFLHARGPDRPVDWATRMRIMTATARGLAHLHDHEKIIHGNLTSANILLDEASHAKLADFGLWRLMSAAANSNVIAAAGALGYRAPELSKLKKASPKTDVYSLGVIMLELLTGKAPSEAMNGQDLPQWVASIVKEEWTSEVFDLELMREGDGSTGDELLNTLKLALHCVDPSPSARPDASEVVRQLAEIAPAVADGRAVSAVASTSSATENVDDPLTNEQ